MIHVQQEEHIEVEDRRQSIEACGWVVVGFFCRRGASSLLCFSNIGYGVVAGFNVGDEKPPHD
jgi:hypothetical protein